MAENHEVFDAEPARELSAGEPRTPMWMPALGAALFVVGGIWFLSGDDETSAQGPATTATASAKVAASVAVPAPKPRRAAPPGASARLRPLRVGKDAKPSTEPARRLPIKAKQAGQR